MSRPREVLEEQARMAALYMDPYVRGRFKADWLVGELGPRLFVGGGAVRAALEVAVHGGRWEPKDLDVFALDEYAAARAIEACKAAGGTAAADGELVWRLTSFNCEEPVDLVLYDLGEHADVPAALATFDFDVNSVAWDGSGLVFPLGRRGKILAGIAERRARVSTEHVFLRRPIRAIRRLNSMIDKGYLIPDEELQKYVSNFVRPTGDPSARIL